MEGPAERPAWMEGRARVAYVRVDGTLEVHGLLPSGAKGPLSPAVVAPETGPPAVTADGRWVGWIEQGAEGTVVLSSADGSRAILFDTGLDGCRALAFGVVGDKARMAVGCSEGGTGVVQVFDIAGL